MELDQNALRAWISTELEAMGRGSASRLAEHMGLDRDKVSRMRATKAGQQTRDIKAHELPLLASFFKKAPPGFNEEWRSEVVPTREQFTPAKVVGVVEAGAWREVDDMDQSEPTFVGVPIDREFPRARILVFKVAGDSMNALPGAGLIEGAQAVCLAYEDVAHRFVPRDGLVVVVERVSDGGHFREWSIKQIEIHDDRMEFHPRSTNPSHKPIVVPIDYAADDGTKIEIIAVLRRVITGELHF